MSLLRLLTDALAAFQRDREREGGDGWVDGDDEYGECGVVNPGWENVR